MHAYCLAALSIASAQAHPQNDADSILAKRSNFGGSGESQQTALGSKGVNGFKLRPISLSVDINAGASSNLHGFALIVLAAAIFVV